MRLRAFYNRAVSRLNFLLYDSKTNAYTTIRFVTLLISIVALCLLLYNFGFEPEPVVRTRVDYIIDFIFVIFLITFAFRWLYSFQRWRFIKNHVFESILMVFIFVTVLQTLFYEGRLVQNIFKVMDMPEYLDTYRSAVSVFMFIILIMEFLKISSAITQLKVKPATTFVLSFLTLVSIGTILLMFPALKQGDSPVAFIDALFTAVSASCVNGLIVVDTGVFWSRKGQIVILALVQLGALGVVSFATFFALFFKTGFSIRQQSMLQEQLSSDSLFSAQGLLRKVVRYTLSIELITFVFIYLSWGNHYQFDDISEKIYFSVFHAISSFCNAGFTLFSAGLNSPELYDAYGLHLSVLFAVILGGIGFPVLQDIFSPELRKERKEKQWKRLKLNSRISIKVSLVLLLVGMGIIYMLEYDKSMSHLPFAGKIVASLFQSGITRSAGFNTVYIDQMYTPTLIILICLMFIGASPGSIGGGIKTTTFYVIIKSALATVRGYTRVEISKRYIPSEIVYKALFIFVFAIAYTTISTFLLSITDHDKPILYLFFEQVSAFSTVGLSTGITSELSDAGKAIVLVSMFIGRVGTLTLALSLSTRVATTHYKYPSTHIMVG